MLNAFKMSVRQARYQADSVACWASMCNLKYDYRKEDNFFVAQKKALEAIRRQGTKVYNFQSNIRGMSAEMDLDFLTYSSEQLVRSSNSRVFTFGAPSFTGFADFSQHLRTSVDPKPPFALAGNGVELMPVIGPKIESTIPAEDIERVVQELARIQTGNWEQSIVSTFIDVATVARANLQATGVADLSRFYLVIVSFKDANMLLEYEPRESPQETTRLRQEMADDYNFLMSKDLLNRPFTPMTADTIPTSKLTPDVEFLKYAWAFCRKEDVQSSFYVAREKLNGTLVLARTVQPEMRTYVAAYLTGLDMMSGAYLLPLNDIGALDLTLRAPQRNDVLVAAKGAIFANRDRRCVAQFKALDMKGQIIAY